MATGTFQRLRMIQPPLIEDIINILREYPDNSQILKEIIQNAEDAGATVVEFILCNESAGVMEDGEYDKYLKGPALCAFNDALFTDDDWRGIRMLRLSNKAVDPLKIGKFGLGFKSIFHLTDFICVASGKSVMFIDPQKENECTLVGLGEFNSLFTDSFSNINTLFGNKTVVSNDNDCLNGTIFWCPLRRTSSRISVNTYSNVKVMDLFHSFEVEASMGLLFMKSLERISLFTSETGISQLFFSVEIDSDSVDTVRSERALFKTKLNEMEKLFRNCPSKILHMPPVTVKYTTPINTCQKRNQKILINRETWLVVHYVHAGTMSEILSDLILNTKNNYRPYVGLAIPFHTNLEHQGHLFCFLPLPLGSRSLTGLSVHVNGYFELSSDRRDLKWPTQDQEVSKSHRDKDISWNQTLIGEVIPVVYGILFDTLAKICQNQQNDKSLISVFWRSIPKNDSIEPKWVPILKPVFKYLFENRLLFASNQTWVRGCEAIFAYQNLDILLSTTVTNLFKSCGQNLVESEHHIFDSIQTYVSPHLKTTTPDLLRKLLKSHDIYKRLDRKQKLELLHFACYDNEYHEFHGIQLIPMADGTFQEFRPRSGSSLEIYLCDNQTKDLLPGLEYLLAVSDQENDILRNLAKTGIYQLSILDKRTIIDLLQAILDDKKDVNKACVINPNDPHVGKRWLGNVWKYLSDNFSFSIGALQHLHLLPIVSKYEANEISLCKIDALAMSSDNDFSTHLITAIKLLGVKFVDDEIVSVHHQMKAGKGLIEHSNPDGLVNLLEKIERKGEKEELINRFNNECPNKAREEIRTFLSQSLSLRSGRGKNVIAKLQIFEETSFPPDRRFSWKSVDENKYLLEQSFYSLPINLPFPLLTIDVFHRPLALSLGGKEFSVLEIIQCIFQKISKGEIYNLSEIRKFIHFVLTECKRWPEYESLRNKAAMIKFVGNGNGELKRANELFDPEEKILKQMFLLEDKFPCESYSEQTPLILLRDIGLRKASDVEPIDIVTTCNFIEKRQNLLQKSEALLRFLSTNPEILKSNIGKKTLARTISSKRCLPYITEKPDTYPTFLPWYTDENSLCQPKDIRLFNEKNLIGSIMPIAPIDIPYRVLEFFTETKDVPIINVIKQFNIIIQFCKVDQSLSRTLQRMCLEIYSYFEQNMQTVQSREIIKNALSDSNVILTDHGFVPPSKVAFSLSIDCSPELFGLNNSPFLQYSTFLGEIGVKKCFKPSDIIHILQEIRQRRGELQLQRKEILLIRNLTILLDDMELEEYEKFDIYLPDTNCILRNIEDLCVDDCKWISDSETMCFVHPDISATVAYKLGIKTKRDHNLLEVCDDDGIEFGQHEELLDRIEGLLDSYQCDSGIMKEFMQNAEDAGATDLQFILDCQFYKNERVFGENWKSIQGPALCVYNNSVFSEKDLKGIQKLGKGSKFDDLSQIGQYGVGFNSVYHITDVPSFLTKDPSEKERERLCIFDPYCLYAPNATKRKPGRMFENLEKLRREYKDVFPCYLENHWPEGKGTLFRLPLRTEEMAIKITQKYQDDKTSRKPIAVDLIRKLLTNFEKDMKESFLFLHNIKSVAISQIDSNGTFTRLCTVEKSLTNTDEEKSLDFSKKLNSARKNALNPFTLKCICVDYYLSIQINKSNKESWLVVQTLGAENENDDTIKFENLYKRNSKYLPLGGVAHFIPNAEYLNAYDDRTFKAFCYLPLPKSTGLPVHIHGHFALEHDDRRNVWWSDQPDEKHTWNKYLIENVIAHSYVVAIQCWKNWSFQNKVECSYKHLNLYHHIFPRLKNLTEDIWKFVAMAVYMQIYEKKSKLFPVIFHKQMEQPLQHNRKQLPGIEMKYAKSTVPVISNWVCVGVDGVFPAYFDDLRIRFERDLQCDYSSSNAPLRHVPDFAITLGEILKRLGLKLIHSPLWIYSTMIDLGIDVEKVTPQAVTIFLKSFNMADEHDRCKLKSVNVDIKETPFLSISNVIEVLNYCNLKSKRDTELEGTPLLVTADMKLRTFSSDNPRYVTRFADLLPLSAHLFIHKSLIPHIGENVTERFPRFFRFFEIADFAKLLPENLPVWKYRTGMIKLEWDMKDEKQNISKSWIFMYWQFLGDASKKSVIPTNSVDEEDGRSKKGMCVVNQSQRCHDIYSKPRESMEAKEDALQRFRCHIVTFLGDWNLYPAFQKQEDGTTKTLHYLIPIKESKLILYNSFYGNRELHSALDKLNLLQPDLSILNDPCSNSFNEIALTFVTTPGNCTHLLTCLNKTDEKCASAKLNVKDCSAILGHFCRNLDDIKQRMTLTEMIKYLKSLPLYVTYYSACTSLTDCATVIAMPATIPQDGVEEWTKKADITLLYQDFSLTELYRFIGCALIEEWEVYCHFIFKKFQLFPENAIIRHMLYLRDELIPYKLHENKFETFRLSLNRLSFIPTKSGHRKMAKQFFNVHNDVFRIMCVDITWKELELKWIEFLMDRNWTEFLIIAGMVNDVSPEQFTEFAKKIELEGGRGITEEVKEKSCILVSYLQNSNKLHTDNNFLQNIASIRFIVPYVIPERFSDLVPQKYSAQRLVCFRESLPSHQFKLVWSTCDILSKDADPDYWHNISSGDKTRIKSCLGFNGKPRCETVIEHAKQFCQVARSSSHKHRLHTDKELQMLTMEVINCLYDFFDADRNSSIIRNNLWNTQFIYILEKHVFVRPKQAILNINEPDTIPPYLYKASVYFGRYFKLFKCLGVSEDLTIHHYVGVLNDIHSSIKNARICPNDQGAVKKAVQKIFSILQQDNNGSTITDEIIYLPSKDNFLIASTFLTFIDDAYLKQRIGDQLDNLKYFVGFKELDILIQDPISLIKFLPEKNRPRMLSSTLTETITSESKNTVVEDSKSTKLQSFLQSNDFFYGILRLVNHKMQRSDNHLDEDKKEMILNVLHTMKILTVEILDSCINYRGQPVGGTEGKKEIMKEIRNVEDKVVCYIYVKKRKEIPLHDWVNQIATELSMIINDCICNVLGSHCVFVPCILTCIEKPSTIGIMLDSKYIRPLEIVERVVKLFQPELGSYVPLDLHHILDNSITEFDVEEYVAFEEYDPDLYSDVDAQKDFPVYIIAQILERLDDEEDNVILHGILIPASDTKYRIDIGNQNIHTVDATQIFKFVKQIDDEDLDIIHEKTVILYHVRNAARKSEQQRNRIIKRLLLHYNPDNHENNKKEYELLFEFLLFLNDKLENGESIDDIEVADLKSVPKKRSTSIFVSNVICRAQIQSISRQSYRPDERGDIFKVMRKSGAQPGQTKRWLLQAKYDLMAASNDMSTYNAYNWACYKCHQAAEKAVKAMQYYIDADTVDRTSHMLNNLACTTQDSELIDLASKLEGVTGNYFQMRYPDAVSDLDGNMRLPSTVYNSDQARLAYHYTELVFQAVQRKTFSV